jgi:beta-lactamase class A
MAKQQRASYRESLNNQETRASRQQRPVGMTIAPSLMKPQFVSRIGTRRMLQTDTEHKAESRALVAIEPVSAEMRHGGGGHSSAAFVAQLLAIKAGLPQTRERRRAEPDVATHSYAKAMTPVAPRSGRVLSRAK